MPHTDLYNTSKILNPKIEISPSTRSICQINSFAYQSVAGHVTTDPSLDVESKILVLEEDSKSYHNDLNNCAAVLSLNPEHSFRTILEAKRRMIPCFSSKELHFENGILKTDTGISIRNGAGITLCHATNQMYAGLLESIAANVCDDVSEFHDVINQNLVDQFGIVANKASDVGFAKGLKAKEIFIELNNILADNPIETLRSELQFLISQNISSAFVFATGYDQSKTDPETMFLQIQALLKAVITSNSFDRVELVLNGCDNILEYKILLDWLEKKLDRECNEALKNIKKRINIHNLDLLSTIDKRDHRLYGVLLDMDGLLKSLFSKSTDLDLLTANVFSGMKISNVREDHPLNGWLFDNITKSCKNLNLKVKSNSILNLVWAKNLKTAEARSYLFGKDTYTANKILFFLADEQ